MAKIRREDASVLRLEARTEPVEGSALGQGVATNDAAPAGPALDRSPGGAPARTNVRRLELRRVRTGIMSFVWFAFGSIVLGYGAMLLYTNVARIEVDSAVVAGTLQPIRAPSAGIVTAQMMRPGDRFVAGEALFTIYDPELDQSIAHGGVRVERAKRDLAQREAELEAERARRENFIFRSVGDIERLAEEVRGLEEVEQSARARHEIVEKLFAQGFATRVRLEEMATRVAQVRTDAVQARSRLAERRSLHEALLRGHGYGSGEVVVRLNDAIAAVERARAEVDLVTEDLNARHLRRAALRVLAPAPGRLVRNTRLDGGHVLAGDTVALVERDEERLVEAFMTQAEAGRVALGDVADVLLPAQRLTAPARVVSVERAGAYLDDVETRYRWNLTRDMGVRLNDRDRSARVTLRFEGDHLEGARRVLDLGTPAVVSFQRRWNPSPFFATFGSLADALSAAAPLQAWR